MMRVSEKEWQVLEVLWASPEGLPLGDIVEALKAETGWSRNTVLTYLTRMESKGLVTIAKDGSPHRYAAAVSRESCAATERHSLLSRVYRGSAASLVAAFLREERLTAQEREELRKLLDDMEV